MRKLIVCCLHCKAQIRYRLIMSECTTISQDLVQNVIDSMPKRIVLKKNKSTHQNVELLLEFCAILNKSI